MRRRLSLVAALTALATTSGLLLAVGPAEAAVVTTTVDGVTYQADDAAPGAGATVTAVDGTAPKDLVLPATVQIGATSYAVTSVGIGAASGARLTSLVLPSSLLTVGESAFLDNDLTTLVVPAGVTSIGNLGFADNELSAVDLPTSLRLLDFGAFSENLLAGITLPEGLVEIDSGAFSFNRLTSVRIPASVTTIGDAAFAENPLTSVLFAGAAPTTFTPGGSVTGSFGQGTGLVVSYDRRFDASVAPGGFTAPTWQGYASQALGAIPPPPTSTTPTTTPAAPGASRPVVRIAKARARTRTVAGTRVIRIRVVVTNTGPRAARRVVVRFRNRPAGFAFLARQVRIGMLPAGGRRHVVLQARTSGTRDRLTVVARSAGAAPDARRVRLPRRG